MCLTRWVRGQGVTSTLLEQVESDGSNLRTIARLEGLRLRCPRWSPDGQYIALVKDVVAGNVFSPVVLVKVSTGEARQLNPKERGGYLSSPAWLEDSSVVAIQATSPEAPNIITPARVLVFDVRTEECRTVAALPHDAPVCDLRNGKLVYEARSRRGNLVEVRLGTRPTTCPDAGPGPGTSIDRQPRYTPDGKGLVFTSNPNDSRQWTPPPPHRPRSGNRGAPAAARAAGRRRLAPAPRTQPYHLTAKRSSR
ncbi:PD40 domain-containing protein [Chloracidobacterium sp. S]|uniref:PD40 domain-containing protein n=1 Tax=Chloracidobacterium aggregatum TaxID=2851959 RepID=UPI001B8B5F18|nr:PD40 domain-containing protein [Chloracidobacterium aggregatum]QUV89568.1 PD40 domain-containing protein [Chloracidobacterium sp. S]